MIKLSSKDGVQNYGNPSGREMAIYSYTLISFIWFEIMKLAIWIFLNLSDSVNRRHGR